MSRDWILLVFPQGSSGCFPGLGEKCGVCGENQTVTFCFVFLLNTPFGPFDPLFSSSLSLLLSLLLSFLYLRMGVKEFLKSRSGLRVDNRATTSAATLTLRQSLWPLTLVTTLFFLWVCYCILFIENPPVKSSIRVLRMVCWTPSTRISRKPYISTEAAQLVFKQPTLGMEFLHNTHILLKKNPHSNKTQRIPPSLPRLRKLDPAQLRLQDCLHLRSVPIRHWSPVHVARRAKSILRRLLRCHIRHWIGTGIS